MENKQMKRIETYVKVDHMISHNIFTTYHNYFAKPKEEEILLDRDEGEFLKKSLTEKKNRLRQNKIIFFNHKPFDVPYIEGAKKIKEKETKKLRLKLLQEKFIFENDKENNLISRKSVKIDNLNLQEFQLKSNEESKSKESIKDPCKCYCF
jgi:hypothetical protein